MADNIASSISEPQLSGIPVDGNSSWRQLGLHNFIKILMIAGLFCTLFQNEITGIVSRWITDSASWGHGFLIPLFSIYFINQHKEQILKLETRPSYLGLVFLICGLVFYLFNIVHFQYGYLSPITMIAVLGTIVLFLGGWGLVRYTWLPVVFLIFAVPLPGRYYVSITMPMRHIAAKVATIIFNLINQMDASVNGVIISVIYKGKQLEPPLNVAEACSGMRLLMAFLALGVAMAYLHYRPVWQRLVLLACTVPIAVFCNIVRVTVTGFIYILMGPKYAQGIYHDILGMTMLPLAFGIYGAIAWFMSSLFVDESELEAPVEDVIVRKS